MKKFDKYFIYFVILMFITVCGIFSYAIITEGFNYDSEFFKFSKLFSMVFSIVGYMFAVMITFGILLAYYAVFDREKEQKDMTEDEKTKNGADIIIGSSIISLFWPVAVVYVIFHSIFTYFKNRKKDSG